MEPDDKFVFISYTSADKERVADIADQLVARGLTIWMDYRRLKPGQNWDFELRRALERSAIIVVFISHNSIKKTGYVQREIRLALEKAEETLVDDIYLIPLLLDDDVTVPSQLKDLQFIKATDPEFMDKLTDAITHQMEKIGVRIQHTQDNSEISWTSNRAIERRDGTPGYEADVQFFRFTSEIFPNIAQIGEYIKSNLISQIFYLRRELVDQNNSYNYGQSRFFRTHTLDISSGGPKLKGRILSILFASHSYYAGAAHPNLHFKSFAFFIDPLFEIADLENIFNDKETAFQIIQSEVRRQLLELKVGDDDQYKLDEEWVARGTSEWSDFATFTFGEHGIEFAFNPYDVAAYAYGPQFVDISYKIISSQLTPLFKTALELDWI